jgi:hypothetical protein
MMYPGATTLESTRHQGAAILMVAKEDIHTMLTRLGETGTDAFTIMKLAGHSSVTVSQRYVHPMLEAVVVWRP